MPESKITTGSPELAKERKLIRELIAAVQKSLGKAARRYKFRRIEEQFGGYKNGYRVEFALIESGKKDRLFQEMKLVFATRGNDYLHQNSETERNRVVVRISGTVRVEIIEPREKTLSRNIWGRNNESNEITFDRNRPVHVLASAIIRLLDSKQVLYDKAKASVLTDTARWDKFAAAVQRVRKVLSIPAKKVWACHNCDYAVELPIPATKGRKTSGNITMSVGGGIKIKIDGLNERKLFKVVDAFK